jgi:CDP-diacylglycerol--glycerol-3-phosphate 3-phosphatidyltransferase
MTIANIITVIRILLVPILLVILLTEMENKEIIAFVVFLVASISDAVDGYIARKLDQITELGKFLDPLADKLLVAAALLALVNEDLVAAWVATVIILREILIAGFRFYFLVKNSTFSASWLAKKKTLFQIISISLLIIHKKLPYPDTMFKIATGVLYFAVFLTVYSGVEYVIKYSRASVTEDE